MRAGLINWLKQLYWIDQDPANMSPQPGRTIQFRNINNGLLSGMKPDGSIVILEGGESGAQLSVELDAQAAGTVVIGELPAGVQPYGITSISNDLTDDAGAPTYKYVIAESDGTGALGDVTVATDVTDFANNKVISEELAAGNLLTTTAVKKYLCLTVAGGTVSGTIYVKLKFNDV